MTDYSTHILPNGLRMIYQFVPSKVSYAGFAVNAGTRDEEKGEEGLAHFVEHLLFKGTLRRKSWHILNRMENVGGELNAYTAKEETVIYSVFLSEHFSRAVDLMSDLILHSQFPEAEVEREVEVILDEINSYRDTPSELIYDEFENFLFGRHALGHNILGDRDTLLSFKSGRWPSIYEPSLYAVGHGVFLSGGTSVQACRICPFPLHGRGFGRENCFAA